MCNCMHCKDEESVKCPECGCKTTLYEDCIVPANGIYTECCDYEWESFED